MPSTICSPSDGFLASGDARLQSVGYRGRDPPCSGVGSLTNISLHSEMT